MSVKKVSIPKGITASLALGAIALAVGAQPASAALLTGTINLKDGTSSGDLWGSDFISFIQSPVNQHPDNYYETVLKLNFAPPGKSPFKSAIFDIFYDANPSGISVNIGDSRSNNGNKGDSRHQSNDAEMQIGLPGGISPSSNDMLVFGNDDQPSGWALMTAPDLVSPRSVLSVTVSNNKLQWNNHRGNKGSLSSPYLYALDGQSDSEGPVNYDIFAAFNRSIGGISRPGSGVKLVRITIEDSQPVPEPSAMLGLLIFGSFGASSLLKSKEKSAN